MARNWINELINKGELPAEYADNGQNGYELGAMRTPEANNRAAGSYNTFLQETENYPALSLGAEKKYEMPLEVDDNSLYQTALRKIADGNQKRYENMLKSNKELEGLADYPYLDSVGNRTIGWGTNIQSPEKRRRVRWNNGVSDEEADRIMRENIDTKAGKNYKASRFKRFSDLRISDAEAERLYNLDYNVALDDARKIFPDLEEMPPMLKDTVVDMSYNLGAPKFKKYRNFIGAVKDGRYADAAAESFRGGVQPERNNRTRDRLLAYDLYLQEKRKHDLLRQMRQGVDMPYLPQTEYWPRKG